MLAVKLAIPLRPCAPLCGGGTHMTGKRLIRMDLSAVLRDCPHCTTTRERQEFRKSLKYIYLLLYIHFYFLSISTGISVGTADDGRAYLSGWQ